MTKTILAIDPSLTNTAVAIGDGTTFSVKCFGSKSQGKSVRDRCNRNFNLVWSIHNWIGNVRVWDIESVYIEGYSFGSNDANARFSAEYGGALRSSFIGYAKNIFEVAPMTLKKFITGTGKGKKIGMVGCIAKNYGETFDTDDEYDAYGLYRLGLVAEGIEEAQNQAQRECADKVLGRVVAKKKKTSDPQ